MPLRSTPIALARADFDLYIKEDPDPDTSYLYQEGFEDRLKAYESDQFSFIGIYAVINLTVAGQIVALRSPGLWGIESDSDPEWLKIVFLGEIELLVETLQQNGFNVMLDHDPEDLTFSASAFKDNSR